VDHLQPQRHPPGYAGEEELCQVSAQLRCSLLDYSATAASFPLNELFHLICRAWSFLTGYLIRRHPEGCTLCYLTQSDPRGPPSASNTFVEADVPRLVPWLADQHADYKISA
jgi:hypothetical protein